MTGLANMRAKIASDVRVVLQHLRDAALRAAAIKAAAPGGAPAGEFDAITQIGDRAIVCVRADSAHFAIGGGTYKSPAGDGMCAEHPVDEGDPAPWVFHVTPQHSGSASLEVQVMAFAKNDTVVKFDSTYTIPVHVGSVLGAVEEFLTDATGLIKLATGLLVAIAAFIVAWRALRKKPGRSDTASHAPTAIPASQSPSGEASGRVVAGEGAPSVTAELRERTRTGD
ncbi:MAG: hypothetical protein ACREPM_07400 [Gemmatimonadaceae bacterium]